MRDIRIISGKRIIPSTDTVLKLIGYQNKSVSDTEVTVLYEKLLPLLKMHIRPNAALAIAEAGEILPDKLVVCVMLTLGENINHLLEKYIAKGDMLSVMVLDAMADSCLFAFEEQLLPMIRQVCITEGYGIVRRLEVPLDMPVETTKIAYEILEAQRTLGISITSGYMLDPVKSMCLLFELTEDIAAESGKLAHDCDKCSNTECGLRQKKELSICINSATEQEVKRLTAAKGDNLLEILRKNGIFVSADCGGKGVCGKCKVLVTEGELPITVEDKKIFSEEELEKGMRLSCKAVLQGNLAISLGISDEREFKALGNGEAECVRVSQQNQYRRGDYGIAIDIGTTTLAFSLLELYSGRIVDTYTAVNHQRVYGADVISRIQAANAGKGEELRQSIEEDIKNGIEQLGIKGRVIQIAIAANTVMLHLLREYSCEGFSRYPFKPVTLETEEFHVEHTKVTLLPGISAFVGADITAGLYACEVMEQDENVLFLDIGTNGEMALKVKDKLYVASTAAGPAFEGGNIKWGVGSICGAISGVTFADGKAKITTIENKMPIGICGTGVVEAVAELLEAGLIDENGKLEEPYFKEGFPLGENEKGEEIVLTQQDIREIQMAKGAIRAGIEILIKQAGIEYKEIEKVYLAGGFGYYLDVKKASQIGLLPKELADKTVAAGNTALKGAIRFLAEQKLKPLQKIAENATEVQLAEKKEFQELYLEWMGY